MVIPLVRIPVVRLLLAEADERDRKRQLRDAVHAPVLKLIAGEHPAFVEGPR